MKNTKNVLFALFAMVSCMSLSAFAEEATEPTVYEFNSINTFITAYNSAQAGDIIRMSADTTVAQLNTTGANSAGNPIYKQVIIDLNGYTLTTTSGWGGMMLGGFASVINGTILHKGNTCAIKAYEVDRLEDLTIIIESAKSNTGGVSLRNHASMGYAHINTIKPVAPRTSRHHESPAHPSDLSVFSDLRPVHRNYDVGESLGVGGCVPLASHTLHVKCKKA